MNERERLFEIWAPSRGVFSAWAKPLLFAQMDEGQIVRPATDRAASAQPWAARLDGRTAVVLDLPGEASVWHGAALGEAGYRPVPLFNGSDGQQPAVEVRSIMLALQHAAGQVERASIADDAPPAFMLDGRRCDPSVRPGAGWFDNRWVVFPQDFPSGRLLRSRGVERALLVREQGRRLGDDLREVLARWGKDGVELFEVEVGGVEPVPLKVRAAWGLRPLAAVAMVMLGLRANSAGGFGARVPMPPQGGGSGFA